MTAGEERLVELVRRVGYGTIVGLRVHRGQAVLDGKVHVRRKCRLSRDDGWRPPAGRRELKVHRQHRDLIRRLRTVHDGLVTIEVQDGLPVFLAVEHDMDV